MAGRLAAASGPYVGRTRELAAAAKLIADDERTGVVLIAGEAGLGKTRLVDEILTAHPGATVVRGGAVPRATPSSFELVRTAIAPHARSWDDVTSRLGAFADAAFAVLDDHRLAGPEPGGSDGGGTVGGPPGSAAPPPIAVQVRAAAEILRALHTELTIFVFEDVHWADPESLEVLDRLMATGPLRATVLVTYRPEALRREHPVNTFLQRAERRARAVQLRLEPLRRDEIAEYLASVHSGVAERTVERVHARTGGNPLFLSELVAAADDDDDLIDSLPWTLAEILRPEIERLPPELRAVAEAVSVLGADAQFDLVAAALSVDEEELLLRLRHLVRSGVLVESGPDRFDFRHELVRDAVADGLFTRERRRIHAAAHDQLVAAGSTDVLAVITHAVGAGRDRAAADAARAGALRAMACGSSHQAFALAEQALLVHGDDVELLRTAVSAGWMTERERAALDHLARWDDVTAGDPEARAEVLHWRVRLSWEIGDEQAADGAADALAGLVEVVDDHGVRAQALADLAQHRMLSGRFADAVTIADRAIDLGSRAGHRGAVLQARAERACALMQTADGRADGLSALAEVAAEAEAEGEWVVASRALHNLPVWGSPDPRHHLERMRSASQRAGLTCVATDGYRFALLDIAGAAGDRAEFEALLDTILDERDATPHVVAIGAVLAASDGRADEARRLLDRIDAIAVRRKFGRGVRCGARSLVELYLTGDRATAGAWLTSTPLSPEKSGMLVNHVTPLLDAGLAGELLAALGPAESFANSDPRLVALEAELRGDLDAADLGYRAASESGERWPVVSLAEVELGRARVARARGEDDGPALAAAARHLSRWPGWHRDRIEQLAGAPCPVDHDPRALTPREREVALLVSRGLTNGGIAEELFISTKTASVHVSNILAKLAMASRTEIAAWVAAGGLEAAA